MSAPNGLHILSRLELAAERWPATPAVVDANGRVMSRAAFADHVRAITSGLRRAGMQPGHRVLFAVRPSADAVALIAALVDLGAVVVAAQVGVGDHLFASQMRLVQPDWVIGESLLLAAMHSRIVRRLLRAMGSLLPGMAGLGQPRMISVGPRLPWLGATPLSEIIAGGGGHGDSALGGTTDTFDAESPCFIVFTSGTTAEPKAVVHSRRSISATLDIVEQQLEIGPGDVLLARDAHLILPALLAGATAVMPASGRFSASRTVATMRRWRVTHLFEVTAHCRMLATSAHARGGRLPAPLKQLLVGAAPVRAAFLRDIHTVLPPGATAWCTYGMTEMLPVAFVSLEEKLAYESDGDIVGSPVHGVTTTIAANGELIVGGPNLFSGYLGGPLQDEHATGDLARLDAGRIVLLGRAKDMIIRREVNIYPELHEPVIERIPGVRRCAMVGVYVDDVEDERVVLAVEAEEGFAGEPFLRDLRRRLQHGDCRIDEAAFPDLIFLAPLPESGRSRKVDKKLVREMALARLACA